MNACLVLVCSMLVFSGLCGCVTAPTKMNVPDNVIPANWSGNIPLSSLPISSGLLDLFHDEQLLDTVQLALRENHDVKATALRLQAASLLLSIPRSQMFPSLSAELSQSRNNQSFDQDSGSRKTDDLYRLGMNVSWELDLWGRLANEYAASRYEYLALEQQWLAAIDSMAARVIKAWIHIASANIALDIEKERIRALERIEVVLMDRYRQGLGSIDELSTAKSRTNIARADLAGRKEECARAVRALDILVGRSPTSQIQSATMTVLPVIGTPPVSVPAEVLKHRPDIASAWNHYSAARETASAAQKALLPDIRISADLFKENASISGIGTSTALWNVLGSLTQPIFQAGRLRNTSKARDLEALAALEDFYESVLVALREAEDSLGREHELANQETALDAAVRDSVVSSQYYEQRYLKGLDTIQNLLLAREQEMAAKLRLNDIRSARLENRIDLAVTLGLSVFSENNKDIVIDN